MQVTVRKARLANKSEEMKKAIEEEITDRLLTAIDYLEQEVPVKSGAYSRSMHLNPRGDTSGTSETSRRKPVSVDPNSDRAIMADRLYASLESIELLDGATLVNNAPHAKYVEGYWGVFDQLRSVLK